MGYYEVLELLKKEYDEITKQKKEINTKLEIALSKNDIAKSLGLSIRSVNQTLKQLIKYDEIEYIKKQINKCGTPTPHYFIKIK